MAGLSALLHKAKCMLFYSRSLCAVLAVCNSELLPEFLKSL
jgi:hypothetical protein